MGAHQVLPMTLIALLIGAALAAETSPAPAVAAQNPQAPDATASAGAPEKQVCRRGVNQTGTRMKQRPVCMTRKEWDDRARHDKELMDMVQRGSTTNTREPGQPQ